MRLKMRRLRRQHLVGLVDQKGRVAGLGAHRPLVVVGDDRVVGELTIAIDRFDVDAVGRLMAGDAARVGVRRGGDAGVRRARLDVLAAVEAVLGAGVALGLDVGRRRGVLVGVAGGLLLGEPLLLPELGPPVLEPHLYPGFRKINFHGNFFPRVDIRIMRLLESPFQFLELCRCERRPYPPLFPLLRQDTVMTRINFIRQSTFSAEIYDFIIIGSGSSGSVIANRLSELPHWRILLLEAGEQESRLGQIPLTLSTLKFTKYDWRYHMEHQPNIALGCEDHLMPWHKGKALGGTSVIDHMIYARGQRYDYDRWAEEGNPGWSYNDVLPYFLKSEKALLKSCDSKYHGTDGYLTVEQAYHSQISEVFIDGLNELGYPTVDYNSADNLGVSTLQATTLGGRRHSMARAFLDPVRHRLNLKILTEAFVTRLLINPETKEAYGVEYERQGEVYRVGASKEVILSAGTINSPHLLMLSGIGPKTHLQEFNIPVLKDSPVGRNLQDHFAYFGLSFFVNQPFTRYFTNFFNNFPILQQTEESTTPMTSLGGYEAIAYIKTQMSEDADPIPDVELLFSAVSFASDLGVFIRTGFGITDQIYEKMFAPLELKQSFMIFPVVLRPKSKGYLKLRSSDPHDYPLLYGNYLTDKRKDDMDTLLAAIRFIQRLSRTEAFWKLNVTANDIPVPGCEHLPFDTEPYWRCCMMFLGQTLNDHVGTAKMGPSNDPRAVVNHELKVHGIGKLRVADCSVIPFAIGGHTGGTAVMIGEKAADLIKSDWIRL